MNGENELRKLPDHDALAHYANVVWRLEAAAGECGRLPNLDGFFALAEYDEALEEAYALGLVGGGLLADGFDAMDQHPAECLGAMPRGEVRRYLHALWRCERHTHPLGSLVQAVTTSGALSEAGRILQFGVQWVCRFFHGYKL